MNDKPNGYGPVSLLLLVVIVAVVVYLSQVAPPSGETVQANPPAGEQASGNNASPKDESPKVKKGDIVCEISAKETNYVVGESPEIEVRLHNKTEQAVTLVGSLDASDMGWRYPYCIFDIKGPPGHLGPGIGRCGNTNPLRKKDFVKVAAGEKFDPFMRIDDYGFFDSSGLDFTRFQVPGKYKVTFKYSTKSSNLQKWVGLEAPPAKDSEVARLFGQVPKFETKSNTIELTFGPPPGGYVPGFKTPLNRAESMGAHFLRMTLGKRPIFPPQMDVVWLVDELPNDVSLLTDLNFVDGYLASVLPVVFNAGGRWTHHVVTLGPDGEVDTAASWTATKMTEEAARTVSKLKARPAVSQKELLTGLASLLKAHTLDPKDKEPSVVVFVLTEKPFDADDVKPLVPEGSDPPGVFRVTRRKGTWIPEKLIGHVRRPQ
ncbi:MAG: hypothetical protein H8E37_07750 [Planctomycetes bacterium]|nr:hypothetical protein [Planctomycetota bacterium]